MDGGISQRSFEAGREDVRHICVLYAVNINNWQDSGDHTVVWCYVCVRACVRAYV